MKIVVRKDRGIDPNRPASLKGRRIGTQLGTSGQYMLARYCEMAGLNMKDLIVVNMSPADMIAATSRGIYTDSPDRRSRDHRGSSVGQQGNSDDAGGA